MAFSQFAIIGRNFELLQETLERQNGEYSTRIYDDIVHLLAGESNHPQGLCRASYIVHLQQRAAFITYLSFSCRIFYMEI